jgi:hypothetical protein
MILPYALPLLRKEMREDTYDEPLGNDLNAEVQFVVGP